VPVHDVLQLLGPTRTASTVWLSTQVAPRTVDRWLASGRLVRLHPGWVTVPELADDWTVRAEAATSYCGGALSHRSALAVHGLVHEVRRLDVTVPSNSRLRSSRWLRIHRSELPYGLMTARGLVATPLPRSLVETWGDAHRANGGRHYADLARGAVLRGVQRRLTTVAQLAAEVGARTNLPGRAALAELLRLVDGGSQSWLEIFGLRHILSVPGLPECRRQHRVVLRTGPVLLDAAWPEVLLAVELDGAAFHGSQEARERDLRRDAALAVLGWQTLRFSYRRATSDPAGCRTQIAQTYRRRLGVVP
jgi:very-short-patch-repair endonuclease